MVEGRLVEAENQEALDTDACHSSWRVGDAIVKCYRRLWRGAHPEPELGRALTELGFTHAPGFHASRSDGTAGRPATVTAGTRRP